MPPKEKSHRETVQTALEQDVLDYFRRLNEEQRHMAIVYLENLLLMPQEHTNKTAEVIPFSILPKHN